MARAGFEPWWPSEKLAVRGYVEVLRHYREIVGIREQLSSAAAGRPDVFIGVDAPDFNLDLEAGLKARGIRTVHFVCPSIWAWRADRVERSARSVDHVLCIFPVRAGAAGAHGIAATYVGHPLANVIPMQPDRAAARAAAGLARETTVLAVLPGQPRVRDPVPGAEFSSLRRPRPAGAARHQNSGACGARPAPAIEQAARAAGLDAVKIVDGPVAHGAGRLRRDADRQRHRDAGGGAVQAPHGDRLQHELAVLADHAPQEAAALGGPAQHPVRRFRGARTAAGRRHAGGAGRRR